MNIVEHLKSRRCDPETYNVIIDDENSVATFLFYTATGQLVGYQQYRPLMTEKTQSKGTNPKDLRYFTWRWKNDNLPYSNVVFGQEFFNYKSRKVFLVEGIFDACALHDISLNALAVLCNAPKPLRAYLRSLSMDVVGVLDGDDPGNELSKVCDRVYRCPPGRDAADMTREELLELLKDEL